MNYQVLVVDDEALLRRAIVDFLQRQQYVVSSACSLEDALNHYQLTKFDLILADLKLPTAAGTDLVALSQGTPVVIMTGYASVRSAVEVIKSGAIDYIAKPFSFEELGRVVRRHLQDRHTILPNRLRVAEQALEGDCSAMCTVFNLIAKLAKQEAPVLITGEVGTGRERVARALHSQGLRPQAPFIAIHCATLTADRIETLLFGKDKNQDGVAGWIAATASGTLFLDSIDDLPKEAQPYILTLLQSSGLRSPLPYPRIIAATQTPLELRVELGSFRSDLFYRLNIFKISLPPLRERGSDILLLARRRLQQLSESYGRPFAFSPAAEVALQHYSWPGNVRELENVLLRAVVFAENGKVGVEQLGLTIFTRGTNKQTTLNDYFRQFVLQHEAEMTETELARALGISRKALWEKRKRLGLERGIVEAI